MIHGKKIHIFLIVVLGNQQTEDNVDVMHIEKNLCDSFLWTLLDIHGKSKDHLNSLHDLNEMGICKELQPIKYHDSNNIHKDKAHFPWNKKRNGCCFSPF